MASYSNLAVQYFVEEKSGKLAGYSNKWSKAMVLSDGELSAAAIKNMNDGAQAVLVCPASALYEEKAEMKTNAENKRFHITGEVCSPLGIAEFYAGQKLIAAEDRNIFVIDMWDTFTDICFLQNEKGIRRLIDVQRVDYGYGRLTDLVMDFFARQLLGMNTSNLACSKGEQYLRASAAAFVDRMVHNRSQKETFTFHAPKGEKEYSVQIRRKDFQRIVGEVLTEVIASMNRLCMLHNVKNGRVILSGQFFEGMDAVKEVKNRFPSLTVFSYKPGEVAVLGGACYSNTTRGCQLKYEVDELQIQYKQRRKMGSFCNLSPQQQEAYRKTLECIIAGKNKVTFYGESSDVLRVYTAIIDDFPEVDIICDYIKCRMLIDEQNHTVTSSLIYKDNGVEMLRSINRKVYEIIANTLKGNKLTDSEILEAIYDYMTKHYRYTKEEKKNGSYPPYAYTLETLLRLGVCYGYAISAVYILRQLQIPLILARGDAGVDLKPHAWNIIQLSDGTYRHLDMTWDLGGKGAKQHLLLDDVGMKARKHVWRVLDYPECV